MTILHVRPFLWILATLPLLSACGTFTGVRSLYSDAPHTMLYQTIDKDNCQSTAKAFMMGGRGEPLPLNCPKETAPAFYDSWESGLRTYCVPELGYALGRSGGDFNPICPRELVPQFKAAYDRGRVVYFELQRLRESTSSLRRRVNDLSRALENNLAKQDATHRREGKSTALSNLKEEELMLRNQRDMLESQLLEMQASINRYEIEK